jgi:hypothetical protein
MPLDSADVVASEVTATENMLAQLYRLRDEGKSLDATIAQVEYQLRRAIEEEVAGRQAAESAKVV